MSWFTRLFGERSRAARSSRPLPVRMRLEELEPRWVPSVSHQPLTSPNWSGYAENAAAGSVAAVSGAFSVPTLTTSTNVENADSAVWVGIDGYSSNSVEQTGIEADVVNGVAQYSAWYEMYPSAPVFVNLGNIQPNDQIYASVTYSGGLFTLSIKDLTDGQSYTTQKSAPRAQRSSAEWIVEAPSTNGALPLANFQTATFTSASATINGTNGSIGTTSWKNAALEQINMVSAAGTVEDNTLGPPNAAGGFSVHYGASTPGVVTTTTLSLTSQHGSSVTLTAVVSPSVPVGSEVELLGVPAGDPLSAPTVLAIGRVQDVNGVEEVVFTGSLAPGAYTFFAAYLGSGSSYQPSTSFSVNVTIPATSGAAHVHR